MTSKPTRRIAIVGGGFSGLAAAHRLTELQDPERPFEVTVFEAGSRVGGLVGTRKIGDYLVETGADSFITNKPWAIDLCKRLGLEDRLIPTDETYRSSLVLRNGKPVPVPDGFLLISPARILPILKSPIFSLCGKLRMGLEYFLPRRKENSDESLAHFVRRRFGREALDRLVQPLVGGIYTSDPEKLSLQATLPRFLDMEREHRSLIRASRREHSLRTAAEQHATGARYGLFLALTGGLSELIDALEKRISESATIRLGTRITQIHRTADRKSWELELEDGSTHEFDAVILTLPTYLAADLISPFDGNLADVLNEIEYASSAIVVTGHKLSDVKHPLNAFGLVIPAIENRKVIAVSFSSRKFPGRAPDGHCILRTFIGGDMQPEMMQHSDDELIAITRSELKDMLGVTGEPDFTIVARYTRSMPQYHVGHIGRVAKIEQLVGQHDGLELAGSAYHGVGLPDSIHSGEGAAERMVDVLGNR